MLLAFALVPTFDAQVELADEPGASSVAGHDRPITIALHRMNICVIGDGKSVQ
jgi:hypothetical protein